jgi:hypothetical protein
MKKITDEMVYGIVGKPTYKPVLIAVPICSVIGVLLALFSNEKDSYYLGFLSALLLIVCTAMYCNIQVVYAKMNFKIVKNALETGKYEPVYGGLICFNEVANIVKKPVGFTDYDDGIHRVICKSGTTYDYKMVHNLIPTFTKWLEIKNEALKIKNEALKIRIATMEEELRIRKQANKNNLI